MDFFGDSTGLYFYSAVFQGNMALLGLLGVIAVFKLQNLASREDRLEDTLWSRLESNPDTPAAHAAERFLSTIKAFFSHVLELEQRQPDSLAQRDKFVLDAVGRMKDIRGAWNHLQIERKTVMRKLWFPLITSFVVIVLSLLLLIVSKGIHQDCITERFFFILTILLQVVVILSMVWYFWQTDETSRDSSRR